MVISYERDVIINEISDENAKHSYLLGYSIKRRKTFRHYKQIFIYDFTSTLNPVSTKKVLES